MATENGEINSSLCSKAFQIYSFNSLLVIQFFTLFINIVGFSATVYLIKFLTKNTIKHLNFRIILISLTCSIILQNVIVSLRAIKIIFQVLIVKNSSACSLVTNSILCVLECDFKLMPVTTMAYGFTIIVLERTIATIFYRTYENGMNKCVAYGLASIPWILTLATQTTAICLALQNEATQVPFCEPQKVVSLQQFIFTNISFPGSVSTIGISFIILFINYQKRKDAIVEIWNQSRLSARYQIDENLNMTRKIIITSSIAVICFALCYFLESFFWRKYSHPIRIIIRELPGIIIGFYGIAFVFIIKYESKTLRKIIDAWIHRVLDKILSRNRDGAYHCEAVNSTNMSVEGKEYFEYYRKLWQAEKPRGWVALRLKYCGF